LAVDRDATEHRIQHQVLERQMELERDGVRERTTDGRLNPGPVLAEEFLDGRRGRREQQLDGFVRSQ